jgi:nucleotide-binding universal stress UspA family protein
MTRRQHSSGEGPIQFERIICGVDRSPQSIDAVKQGVALSPARAHLAAVAVWNPGLASYAGIHAPEVTRDLRMESVEALEAARDVSPDLELVLMRGTDVSGLLQAAAEARADLVCVGSHGGSRMAGIAFGSVASGMVRHAPCSVLVARPLATDRFAESILHATDGSPDSIDAARLVAGIATIHGSKVVTVSVDDEASRGQGIAEESAALIGAAGADAAAETRQGSPHREIVEIAQSKEASLIVLGSRGMTGLKALGSVSERVAHQAPCSVLVVRRPAHPQRDVEGDQPGGA